MEKIDFTRFLLLPPDLQLLDLVLNAIPTLLVNIVKDRIIRKVKEYEIRKAIFTNNPLKSPRLDGMTAFFYQIYWNILSSDICEDVKKITQDIFYQLESDPDNPDS